MIRQLCSRSRKPPIQSPTCAGIESGRRSISALRKALCFCAAVFISTSTAFAQTSAETPQPAENANICQPLGPTYFYVSSMESCVRIGGEVQASQTYTRHGHLDKSAIISYSARSRTYVDIWQDSEYGIVRTYGLLEGTTGPNPYLEFDKILMRIGNLDFGRNESITNIDHGSYVFRDSGYFYGPDNTVWQVKYRLGLGPGISVSKAIEQPVGTHNFGDSILQQDNRLPDITLAARYVQDWGNIQVSGGSHMNQTKTREFTGGHTQKFSKIGFFGSIGAEYNVTQSLQIGLTASYADGALSRIGIHDPSDSIYYNRIMVNSKGHNFFGGISYQIIPNLKFNANGGFRFSREGFDHNKEKWKSYLAGTSLDYRLFGGTTLTIGGAYQEIDFSKTGSSQSRANSDGKGIRYDLIAQIRQQF